METYKQFTKSTDLKDELDKIMAENEKVIKEIDKFTINEFIDKFSLTDTELKILLGKNLK